MLHMEVIQERLEREFDLDLVTTLPSVIYEVYKTDGTMVRVDNPHNYPDPSVIEHAEEPYVKVDHRHAARLRRQHYADVSGTPRRVQGYAVP